MNGLTRHELFNGIVLLNLVLELKFLDVFMGREDRIEFDIFLVNMEFVCYIILICCVFC